MHKLNSHFGYSYGCTRKRERESIYDNRKQWMGGGANGAPAISALCLYKKPDAIASLCFGRRCCSCLACLYCLLAWICYLIMMMTMTVDRRELWWDQDPVLRYVFSDTDLIIHTMEMMMRRAMTPALELLSFVYGWAAEPVVKCFQQYCE